jgi:hypothetical protein
VFGVPIRKEDAAEASQVEKAIQQAIKEAEYAFHSIHTHTVDASISTNRSLRAPIRSISDKGVHGNDVTPFLLQRVNELTGGESLKSSTSTDPNNAHELLLRPL